MKRKIYIGTSGWAYNEWKNIFYPLKLSEHQLTFYTHYFNTVELNNSFYKLPSKKLFEQWKALTPAQFRFAVKISRYISHVKKLKVDARGRQAIRKFIKNAISLENKLAVILIQLPSNFKINIDRLENFIIFTKTELGKFSSKTEIAVEFRHESWFTKSIFSLLKKHNVASVISHSIFFPISYNVPANFTYIRLHGPSSLYASSYSKKELEFWKKTINNLPKSVKKIYVYFNNDINGYAIYNALDLKKLF